MKLEETFRRTASGEEALHSVDTSIPVDYRRILALIDRNTHANVIRGRLRQYSDSLIADWLAELEELGFIESTIADAFYQLEFKLTASDSPSVVDLQQNPDEQRRVEDEVKGVDVALKHKGVYLATDRLRNRAPLLKEPSQIVILLVEDDPDQAALGDLRVSMAGYRVRLARNGREIVNELVAPPAADLVLLDVLLPDANGFEILAGMRQHPKFSLLPVIILTVLGSPEDIRRGLNLGADGYMTKPYSKNVLIDTVRQVLGHA